MNFDVLSFFIIFIYKYPGLLPSQNVLAFYGTGFECYFGSCTATYLPTFSCLNVSFQSLFLRVHDYLSLSLGLCLCPSLSPTQSVPPPLSTLVFSVLSLIISFFFLVLFFFAIVELEIESVF